MRFRKFAIELGCIVGSNIFDSEALDQDRLADCAIVLRHLKSNLEDRLSLVANYYRAEIDQTVRDNYRAEIRRALKDNAPFKQTVPTTGDGLSISIGSAQPLAIDNPQYEENCRGSFQVWSFDRRAARGLIFPETLSENSASARIQGTLAGSRLRDISDEDLATYTESEEDRSKRKEYVDEIVSARPCMMVEVFDTSQPPDLQELILNLSIHFGAAMLSPHPF